MDTSLELIVSENPASANEPWPEVHAPPPYLQRFSLYRVGHAGTARGVAPAADGGRNGGSAPFPAQIP